jgi:Tol biopolymer transport system component
VFVKTTGEETLNRSWASGNLYKLSPIAPDGVVTPITNFTGASISDPAVSFDGKKILFSMRPPGGVNRNIYEINADGTGCARSRAAAARLRPALPPRRPDHVHELARR